jgi:hypothetical protein
LEKHRNNCKSVNKGGIMKNNMVIKMSTILVVILTVIFPIDGILKAEAAKKSAKTATYEEYVTGEYLKQYEGISHSFSRDGSRMLTKCTRTVNYIIEDHFILWDFDLNLNTYVINGTLPFIELDIEVYLSPDGQYVPVLRASKKFDPEKGVDFANHRTDILRVSDGKRVQRFPIYMHSISFSPDNAMIAGTVIRPPDRVTGAERSDNFEIHSVESGKRIATPQNVGAIYTPAIFDPRNRYLAVSRTLILDTKNFSEIEQWPKTSLAAVSPDGSHIALRVSETQIRTFKMRDYAGQWTEVGAFECVGALSFGPQNTLAAEAREYDLEGTEIRSFSSGFYPVRVYVKDADTWFGFNNDRVSREQPISERSLQAAGLVSEGKRLLKAGFDDLGVKKIKEGIRHDPDLFEFITWFSGGTLDLGLNLAGQGGILAQYIQANPNNFSGYYIYGLLASAAGHPGLVDQAVQRIRQLGHEAEHPLTRQDAEEKALILEALNIATRDSQDSAYRYLVELGVKLDPGDFIDEALAENFLFPLFQDRKKLMYILDDAPEPLLPRPGM